MKISLSMLLQAVALIAAVKPSSASCPYLMAGNVNDSAQGLDNPHEKTMTVDKPCDDSLKQDPRHLEGNRGLRGNTDARDDHPSFPIHKYPLTPEKVRSFNGTETSLAGSVAIRIAEADHTRLWEKLPNPRMISNNCSAETDEELREVISLTDMTWQFGQFLDHDIVLTLESEHKDFANITCPEGDSLGSHLPFTRSEFIMVGKVRQQLNRITAAIDGSAVYGSDDDRAAALRTFNGGKLKTSGSKGNLLPLNTDRLPNAGGADNTEFFLAGDVRANEQLGLISMHTLFVREHNRLAERIARLFPGAGDDLIYQLARKIVGAEIQIITYKEFLPALLGDKAPKLSKYKAGVNPSIANEFSTAMYRFGHSMLSPVLKYGDGEHDSIKLKDAFFKPGIIQREPLLVDHLLGGLISNQARPVDAAMIEDVRNFLFGEPGKGGLDLAALNIQRGRDHGIPGYNKVREAYGLKKAERFEDISSNDKVVAGLREAYDSPDQVDAWIGGLCEDTKHGVVGELIATALNEQFTRIMQGDPFFYLNDKDLQHGKMKEIIDLKNFGLAQVIAANTVLNPSGNVFKMPQ